MDIPELRGVKRKTEETHVAKRQKDDITLIAADGKEFIVPKNVAEQSQTIKYLLEDLSTQEVSLANVSSAHLKALIEIMTMLHEKKEESKKAILLALEQLSLVQQAPVTETEQYLVHFEPWYDWSQLLLGANYLDLGPIVLDFLAKKVVDNALKASDLEPVKGHTIRDMDKYIARHYYLRFGQNMPGVDPNSYGFSVAELRNFIDDAKRYTMSTNHISFDLSELRINDLDGLSEYLQSTFLTYPVRMPTTIRVDLSHNFIEHLDAHYAPAFKHVTSLNLSANKITSIDPGIFNDNTTLQAIFLSNNMLTYIPAGVFTVPTLRLISIGNNKISDIADNAFAGLQYLTDMYLDNNNLTHIKKNMFAQCNSESLNLSNNNIGHIDDNSFISLNRLLFLFLYNNKLTSISRAMLNGLIRLRILDLDNNLIRNIPDDLATISRMKLSIKLKNNPLSAQEIERSKQSYENTNVLINFSIEK